MADIEFMYNVVIVPVWASRNNDNLQLADLGSKFKNSTYEWSVDVVTFKDICNYFTVKPTFDCFSSQQNRKCKRFFSKIPQVDSIGVNFFAQKLNSGDIYWACPDIFKFLSSCKHVKMIVSIPVWKNSNCWPYIVRNKFFHPLIQKFKIIKPTFIPFNGASNIFTGMKKFQTLAVLARSNTNNSVQCPI